MRINTIIFSLICWILFTGCAMSYTGLVPATAFVNDTVRAQAGTPVKIICSGNTITQTRQNWWAERRLADQEIILIAVKVINYDTIPFLFSYENLEFFNNYSPAPIIKMELCYPIIRQKYWPNILFIPLTLASSYSSEKTSTPSGSPIIRSGFEINILSGAIAVWGAVNSLRTFYANRRVRNDLNRFNLENQQIPPGSEVFGLVALKSTKISNPMVRIKNKKVIKHPQP